MAYKNIVLIPAALAALCFMIAAAADESGPYVGGMLGEGFTHYPANNVTNASNINNKGLAGRVFGGYAINPYLAAEIGYEQFTPASYKVSGVSTSINERGVDVMAKATLPLGESGFAINARGGAAYMDASSIGKKVLPAVGAGLSYDLSPSMPIELTWMHFQHSGSSSIQNADLVGLGLSYRFN